MTKIKLSSLSEHPNNPRLITKEKLEDLKGSITELEMMLEARGLIIDENGVILGGNQRYKALLELGYEEIPKKWVTQYKNLTEEEKLKIMIADNGEAGSWDREKLAEHFKEEVDLKKFGADVYFPEKADLQGLFAPVDESHKTEAKGEVKISFTENEFDQLKSLSEGESIPDYIKSLIPWKK